MPRRPRALLALVVLSVPGTRALLPVILAVFRGFPATKGDNDVRCNHIQLQRSAEGS